VNRQDNGCSSKTIMEDYSRIYGDNFGGVKNMLVTHNFKLEVIRTADR
jgi:hypothetical protein